MELYQATDGRQYAVKRMLYEWDDIHYQRFVREVEIMSKLVHQNIIEILNFNVEGKSPWYVMPYYQDGSLRERLLDLESQGKRHSPKQATGLIYFLAEAISHAHRHGVIHRDLKPENILFDGKRPIIADWGIGKFIHRESQVLTRGGIGTKNYCSPEQWESGKADARSDIYSLGVIYRELISGTTYGHIGDKGINRIVDRMTKPSPAERFQSIDELLADIRSLQIVSAKDPLSDFWNGVFIVAGVVGIVYLLTKIFER